MPACPAGQSRGQAVQANRRAMTWTSPSSSRLFRLQVPQPLRGEEGGAFSGHVTFGT